MSGFKRKSWLEYGSPKLTKRARKYLKKRGISMKTAEKARLRSLTADQTAELWSNCPHESLLFPFDENYGQARIFWPNRTLEDKEGKFRSSSGPSRMYTPEVLFGTEQYNKMVADPERIKLMSEAPTRVLAGYENGLLVHAFAGCWNWQSGRKPIPELRKLLRDSEDSVFEIVPDVDLEQNNSVALAYLRLGDYIRYSDSNHPVKLVQLRPVAGSHTGLDDYLAYKRNGYTRYGKLKRYGWDSKHVAQLRINAMDRTEVGLGNLIINQHGADLRFDAEDGQWYVWNGAIWVPQTNRALDVQERAKETLQQLSDDAQRITDETTHQVMAKWAARCKRFSVIRGAMQLSSSDTRIRISAADLNANRFLVAVRNGVIDLKSSKFMYADRNQHCTLQMAVSFNAAADCPKWDRVISEIMLKNRKMVDFMQRLLGYFLVGGNLEQIVVFFQGEGGNGKSVVLKVVQTLLGTYATTAKIQMFLKRKDEPDPERATPFLRTLRGRRLIGSAESSESMVLDEANIKRMSGGDILIARGLNSNPVEFAVSGTIVVVCNKTPQIDAHDKGVWRRLIRVPFERVFTEKEKDIRLADDLLSTEGSGILNWLLEGARIYLKEGLQPPKKVVLNTQELRNENDMASAWFSSNVVEDVHEKIARQLLYRDFSDFCFGRDKPIILSDRQLYTMIRERGFADKQMTGGGRYFYGLRLKTSKELSNGSPMRKKAKRK